MQDAFGVDREDISKGYFGKGNRLQRKADRLWAKNVKAAKAGKSDKAKRLWWKADDMQAKADAVKKSEGEDESKESKGHEMAEEKSEGKESCDCKGCGGKHKKGCTCDKCYEAKKQG